MAERVAGGFLVQLIGPVTDPLVQPGTVDYHASFFVCIHAFRVANDPSCPRRASRRPSGSDAQAQGAGARGMAAESACQTSLPVYRCTTRAITHARTSTTNSTAPTRKTPSAF
jgi:hypothetical protein